MITISTGLSAACCSSLLAVLIFPILAEAQTDSPSPFVAHAAREFAHVEIGGVRLAIPRTWVLERKWEASNRNGTKRGNILPSALISPTPLVVTTLDSCCRVNRLAPIFPERLPFMIVVRAGGGKLTAVESTEKKLERLKETSEEVAPHIWRFIKYQYYAEMEKSNNYYSNIRYISCPEEESNNNSEGLELRCRAYVGWRKNVSVRYDFHLSRFSLDRFSRLDSIVINLLSRMEYWSNKERK